MGSLETSPSQIPVSVAERPGEISLTDLLLEVRLEIWEQLLGLSNVPRSYGYTGLPACAIPSPVPSWPVPDRPSPVQLPAENATMQDYNTQLHLLEAQCVKRMLEARQKCDGIKRNELRLNAHSDIPHQNDHQIDQAPTSVSAKVTKTHSMILVSKQLSSEYRQVYYERTTFFFLINEANILHGIPHLTQTRSQHLDTTGPPNFWRAPPFLFRNLRACTIYIDLGAIENTIRPLRFPSAGGPLACTAFDTRITRTVQHLVASMHQLRTIQLVWATTLADRIPRSVTQDRKLLKLLAVPSKTVATGQGASSEMSEEEQLGHARAVAAYNWDVFIAPFVETLLEKSGVTGFKLRFGDVHGDMEYAQEKGAGGKWEPR